MAESKRTCDCGAELRFFTATYGGERGVTIMHTEKDGKKADLDHFSGYDSISDSSTVSLVWRWVRGLHARDDAQRSKTIVSYQRPCICGGQIIASFNRYADRMIFRHEDKDGAETVERRTGVPQDVAELRTLAGAWVEGVHDALIADKLKAQKGAEVNGEEIRGKYVCVTGVVPNYTREQADRAIAGAGGYPQSRVNAATDLVIRGDRPGQTKLNDAAKYGAEIKSGDWLLAVIRENTRLQNLRNQRKAEYGPQKEDPASAAKREAERRADAERSSIKPAAPNNNASGKSMTRRMSLAMEYLEKSSRVLDNASGTMVDLPRGFATTYEEDPKKRLVRITVQQGANRMRYLLPDLTIETYFGLLSGEIARVSGETLISTVDAIQDDVTRKSVAILQRLNEVALGNIQMATGKGEIAANPRTAPPVERRERRERREGRGDW